nr:peptidyl-prolyl cis-trans isomerase G-like isoform X1 [Onthophagus taurus]
MPMELKEEVNVKSEDEEDELEKLRLVALQSLKKPAPINFKPSVHGGNINNTNNNKRRNFVRNRNGQFRIKNTNLISIPTIDDNPQRNQDVKTNSFTKLILPQDRYSNVKKGDEKTESSSKFDRYDNSDKSESETDYRTDSETENESPGKLERADSLEALMQELENEIQGNSQTKSDEVKKKIKKRKKRLEVEVKDEVPEIVKLEVNQETLKSEDVKIEIEKEVKITKEIETKPNLVPPVVEDLFPQKRSPPLQRNRRPFQKFDQKIRKPRQPYNNHSQYTPGPLNYQVPPPYNPPHLYNPLQYPPAPIITPQIHPNLQIPQQQNVPPDLHHRMFYERPLSPLKLNTDDVLTIARAPLSPRSAAFVLQNRDAIERRKKSPRRSYSRSPSPRYHRSKSKSRSRTPLKDERRITPVKEIRKRSPLRRRSAERRSPENLKKKLVKERLGNKKKRSRSLSPAVTNKIQKIDEKLEEKLDPVLEARKRKFETNGIKNKEGIIRLRPKQEDDIIKMEPPKTENIKIEDEKVAENPTENILPKEEESPEPPDTIEDDLEENFEDILNPKVDDIFSDEETDSENEGRFKNSMNNEKKSNVRVVPFSKLLDSKPKSIPLDRTRTSLRNRDNHKVKGDHKERLTTRKVKTERKEKLVPTIESKKIEIKIRNPSKYETTSKYDVKNEKERPSRKVEVAKKEENNELNAKVDLEDDENGFSNQKCDSGDLRAQLSRKRAERQSRLPTVENVPSRLLQNALQGAVFKKQKKIKSENETAPKDGKMPIHLRLGIASGGGEGPQETVKPKKVQGKSKGRADQVLYPKIIKYLLDFQTLYKAIFIGFV